MAYQRKDAFYARAKAAGYRSRAAYKLDELARRYKLIGRGDHAVDLGAWPGGWLQVAAQLAGPTGVVVGVDLQAIDRLPEQHVATLVGDARDDAVQARILERCRGRVDVLLSDMAPKLSGIRDRDIAQSVALAEAALDIAARLLRPGGRLLLKVFTAAETEALVARAKTQFESVRLTKPEATRKGSAELYLVGTGHRPGAQSTPYAPPGETENS